MNLDEIIKYVEDGYLWFGTEFPSTTLSQTFEIIIRGRNPIYYDLTKKQFIFVWYYFIENWEGNPFEHTTYTKNIRWSFSDVLYYLNKNIYSDEQKIYLHLKYGEYISKYPEIFS